MRGQAIARRAFRASGVLAVFAVLIVFLLCHAISGETPHEHAGPPVAHAEEPAGECHHHSGHTGHFEQLAAPRGSEHHDLPAAPLVFDAPVRLAAQPLASTAPLREERARSGIGLLTELCVSRR